MRWSPSVPLLRIGPAAGLAGLVLTGCALMAGCASAPRPAGEPARSARPANEAAGERDGPGRDIPPDLASVADAEPRVEPIRPSGANKPYQVLGQDYVPIVRDAPFRERGLASWYGAKFHGRRTASGEVYDMYAMTAAHPTLPIPSYARVRNPANGRAVLVRINDRGPFHGARILDLSYAAAFKLDLLRAVAPVEVERLTFDDIRAGLWRRPGPAAPSDDPGGRRDDAPVLALVVAGSNDVILDASPVRSAAASRGYWVQLGAFRERGGAELLQRRVVAELDSLSPMLATFNEATLFRVQAGPYPSRDEAIGAAVAIRTALGLVPVIVERR